MKDLFTKAVKAKVYRNGAEVIRRGSVELEAGVQSVCVHGFSASAHTDTARILCQEGLSCSDMRLAQSGQGEESPREKELRAQIDALKAHADARRQQIDMWKANGDLSSRTSLPIAELEQFIEKYAERIEALGSDIRATEKKIEELKKELEEVCEADALPVMIADVTAEKAGTYSFELRCFEGMACWNPIYEVRSDGEGPLTILMKANISQNSSQDWESVELSLFTGDPVSSGSVPRLLPLFLDIRQPRPVASAMGGRMMMKANMAFAMEDAAEESADLDGTAAMPSFLMATPAAAENSTETATEYVLPGRRDVKKNGEGTIADVTSYTVPCTYRIVSVPQLDQSAYLVAAVKAADLPMHSCVEAAVYLGDIYQGKVWLDPQMTDEETELTLGKEEKISVRRKELRRKTSTTLLKGLMVVEYAYEISISNNGAKAAEVIVKDQVPVSENKEIEVELLDASGAEHSKETGLLSWKVALEPGQSKALNFSYKTSRPKDKQIEEHRRDI